MSVDNDMERIKETAHFWNWLPDWGIVQEVYRVFPDSYSILTPFAYAYLEELIRSMTTEYGSGRLDELGMPRKHKVGQRLVRLAIAENKIDNPELAKMLEQVIIHFAKSQPNNLGENRNSVVHGYMHPKFWDKDSFETLVHDIALLSKHAGF